MIKTVILMVRYLMRWRLQFEPDASYCDPHPRVLVLLPEDRFVQLLKLLFRNILSKSLGSNNPVNVLRATIKALGSIKSLKEICGLRDRNPDQIFH